MGADRRDLRTRLLQHEYRVDLAAIDWRQAGVREPGRIEKVELKLPKGVKIARCPSGHQRDAGGRRSRRGDLGARPGRREAVRRLQQIEADYFRKTRIYPIMHVVVLRSPCTSATAGSP